MLTYYTQTDNYKSLVSLSCAQPRGKGWIPIIPPPPNNLEKQESLLPVAELNTTGCFVWQNSIAHC